MKEKEIENIASEHYYRQIFNWEYNIEFRKPKKDVCDKCAAYDNMSEENKSIFVKEQEMHLSIKRMARESMSKDKEEVQENTNICTACFDVEQTLITPRTKCFYSLLEKEIKYI